MDEGLKDSTQQNDTSAKTSNSLLGLGVFKAISEARSAHGLRLQDPVRYNTYCAKRILSLKKALKFIQKSKKAAPKPITTEHVAQDIRYLEIVLYSAERAWSQSAGLKSDGAHKRKKHHITRRLKKAVHYAELLSTLLDSINADTQTRLESQAYKATLAGQSAFERKRWDVALREYSIAKVILDVLLSKADDASRSIYKEASVTVDPSLRYCGYQLQIGSQGDILTLARSQIPRDATFIQLLEEINPSALQPRQDGASRAGITSIQWRSRIATLEHPEIVVSLLRVQDTQNAFDERVATFDLSVTEKATAMDEILNAWAEAETSVRRIIDEGVATRQDKEQTLQIILTYVSFHFITTRVQRDVLLVKDLEQRKGVKMAILKDLVKLHDSIIQSIRQIYDLPGVAADTQLTNDLDAKQTYFKASRCVLIARSHTLLKDHVSALAMYERAQTYLSKIPLSLGSLPEKDIPVSKDDVSFLSGIIDGEMTRSHAHAVLSQPNFTESECLQKKPLLSKLHQFPRPNSIDLTNLVDFPPKLQPVPVKPYFFDIAYNYIGLEERQAEKPVTNKTEEKKPEPAKKGWFW